MEDGAYEIGLDSELRNRHGLFAENRPVVHLDPKNVPEPLHAIIRYAELWGITDDLIREDVVRRAPKQAIDELRRVIEAYDDQLDEWLAGPEASDPTPSKEYLAFSAMRMAADLG